MTAASFVKNVRGPPILATDKWGKMLRREKVMKILIFTCLCQRATHCCNVVLHPLQMLLVLSAAHNEGKDVFLQLKTSYSITLSLEGRGRNRRKRQGHQDLHSQRQKTYCYSVVTLDQSLHYIFKGLVFLLSSLRLNLVKRWIVNATYFSTVCEKRLRTIL